MKKETSKQLELIGERFGKDISDLVNSNRAFTVTVKSVDADYAYVTKMNLDNDITLPVPLTGMNILNGSIKYKPSVESLAVIMQANSSESQPFFIALSKIDGITFTRGKTTFNWSITSPSIDADGNEIAGETDDKISLSLGDSVLNVTKDIWEFNGGDLGGLTKTQELKTQLDKVTARIDGIIDAITNAVPVTDYSGAGLQASIVAGLQLIIDLEDFSQIENTKITQ
jgi:hypothetical protein